MKPFAVTLLIVIVYFAFIGPVSAECFDWASCKGDKAEIDARMSPWAKETAEAKAAERQATAEARQATADARRATTQAKLHPTATYTPWPTMIPQPSVTVQATSTPQMVIVQIVVTQTPVVVIPAPTVAIVIPATKRDAQLPSWAWNVFGLIGVGLVLFAVIGLRKPTTK